MKVADYISEYLDLNHVTHVFGVSGANIEDLYSSIASKKKTQIVLAKNEYNASTMAIGSYLASQKPAVVLTTSGPGTLNTLPVLAEAFTSKIPFVLISGIVPKALEGRGAFQDTSGVGGTVDLLMMIKQCSCYQIKISDPDEIPNALHKAFSKAMLTKKPAVILIPKNLFGATIINPEIQSLTPTPLKISCPLELINAKIFCREFSRPEHNPPLIILGEELIHQHSLQPIYDFIKKSCGALALVPNSKGLFDHKHSQFLGLIGIMGHNEVNEYLKKTDHVLIVATSFDLLSRLGIEDELASKNLLIIKEQKSDGLFTPLAKTFCELYGSLDEIFTQITESIVPKNISSGEKKPKPGSAILGYNVKNIIGEIQNVLDDDANVFIDAGNTGAFVIHHLETSGQGICYISLGMGGMGNSIGAGIGSAIVSKKRSYVFLGDGSFLMHGLELHTAREYNLPVVFFIFNNNSHGMCSTRENVFLGGETGLNNFRESHYALGMAAFFPGITTFEVTNMTELKDSLKAIKSQLTPCVISLNIPNTEDPPFRTFKRIEEVQQ